jgi:hypothetical protein
MACALAMFSDAQQLLYPVVATGFKSSNNSFHLRLKYLETFLGIFYGVCVQKFASSFVIGYITHLSVCLCEGMEHVSDIVF